MALPPTLGTSGLREPKKIKMVIPNIYLKAVRIVQSQFFALYTVFSCAPIYADI